MAGPDDCPYEAQYSLYACVVHEGSSCFSGHYYSMVKSPAGQWFEMDDSSVRSTSLHSVLDKRAYILMYVRNTVLKSGASHPVPAAPALQRPLAPTPATTPAEPTKIDKQQQQQQQQQQPSILQVKRKEQQQQQAQSVPSPAASSCKLLIPASDMARAIKQVRLLTQSLRAALFPHPYAS
jgi:hypothetical protein